MRHSSAVSWLVAAAAACAMAGCAAPSHFTKPQSPGIFTACSPAPHCVSSQAAPGSFHYVEPFRFTGSANAAHRALSQTLRNDSEAIVEKDEGNFVHATFQTTIGFVDDVDVRPADGVRVVQLTPPGSGCSIGMGEGLAAYDDRAPGSVKALHLVVADIEEARNRILERGAEVGEIVDVGGGVKYASISDPDGNTLVLQEMAWRSGDAF